MLDAEQFVESGLVDPVDSREVVGAIPDSAYARYPALSPDSVAGAVAEFLSKNG
jgi:hypothetical protein